MKKLNLALRLALVVAVVAMAFGSGCRSNSGSKEFIPGKGWRNS